MSKPLTENLFADTWTSSREGFPVNLTQAQESDSERTTNATCGPKCVASYQRLPRPTLWAKTFAAFLIGTMAWSSRRCALTWKLWGTKYGRASFQLRALAHPTDGIGFGGLLPTPRATEIIENPINFAKRNGDRTTASLPNLQSAAKYGMLPTPAARDYKGASSTEALQKRGRLKEKADSLPDQFNQTGKSSQLNPRFVAEMMGFPVNWTELPFQSGEPSQSKPTETR